MDDILERLPYWKFLSREQKQFVAVSSTIRHYQNGNLLMGNHNNDTTCFGMIYMLSGEARAALMSLEGRKITLFRIPKDDYCVLSASCVISQLQFDTQITVTEDADILIVPTSTFGKLAEDNIYVKCFLYELATGRFSTVMKVVQQMLFDRFDQRFSNFLLSEYRKNGSCEIHMTQEQIAQNVNSVREVVSRTVKKFSNEKLIEYHRGLLILKDIPALEKIVVS